MILGDPYKFAVIIEAIKEWNTCTTFCNGVLFFCIDGDIFPKAIDTATLTCELSLYEEKFTTIIVNHELYDMPKEEAFVCIYNLVHPEDWDIDNDYRFDFSPETLSNANCKVFVVSNGEYVRIMAASELLYNKEESRHELDNILIAETIITVSEFHEIISALNSYVDDWKCYNK